MNDLPRRMLCDDVEQGVFMLLDLPAYYRPMLTFKDGRLVLFDAMPTDPIILVRKELYRFQA